MKGQVVTQFPPAPQGPQAPPNWGPPPSNVPPPGWTGPGGPTAPKANRTGLFVVLGLLVLAAVGGAAFMLTSDSNSSTNIGDPVEALQAFYEAGVEDDCAKGVDLITENSWGILAAGDEFTGDLSSIEQVSRDEAIERCEAQAGDSTSDELNSATLASEEGNTAVVTAAITSEDDGDFEMDFHLVKEDDGWKIDLVATLETMLGGLSEEDLDVPDVDDGDFTEEDLTDLEEQLEDLEDEIGTDFTIPED